MIECLRSKALDIIKGLAVTEVNYDAAIDQLFECFENSERLVTVYYEELKEINFSSDPTEQRSNYDAILKILKNLESVGITIDQDYFRTIIMSKFSCDTLRGALRGVKRKEDGAFTISDLMPVIDHTLKIEEAIDLAHKGSSESKASSSTGKITIGAFVSGTYSQNPKRSNLSRSVLKNKLGLFCGENTHNSHMCLRFNSLDRRRSILLQKGPGFTCLGSHNRKVALNVSLYVRFVGKLGIIWLSASRI